MLKAFVKILGGCLVTGAGIFVALMGSGIAGDGVGELFVGGGSDAKDTSEKEAGFRRAGN